MRGIRHGVRAGAVLLAVALAASGCTKGGPQDVTVSGLQGLLSAAVAQDGTLYVTAKDRWGVVPDDGKTASGDVTGSALGLSRDVAGRVWLVSREGGTGTAEAWATVTGFDGTALRGPHPATPALRALVSRADPEPALTGPRASRWPLAAAVVDDATVLLATEEPGLSGTDDADEIVWRVTAEGVEPLAGRESTLVPDQGTTARPVPEAPAQELAVGTPVPAVSVDLARIEAVVGVSPTTAVVVSRARRVDGGERPDDLFVYRVDGAPGSATITRLDAAGLVAGTSVVLSTASGGRVVLTGSFAQQGSAAEHGWAVLQPGGTLFRRGGDVAARAVVLGDGEDGTVTVTPQQASGAFSVARASLG